MMKLLELPNALLLMKRPRIQYAALCFVIFRSVITLTRFFHALQGLLDARKPAAAILEIVDS